jgi:hypothetical protein
MDQELTLRYLAIFDDYGVEGFPFVNTIKGRLSKLIDRQAFARRPIGPNPRLRADAALCLLTLFDLMIVRPYWGSNTNNPGGRPLNAFNVPQDSLEKALSIILAEMLKTDDGGPSSSHDVLQSIERTWPKLAALFGWA